MTRETLSHHGQRHCASVAHSSCRVPCCSRQPSPLHAADTAGPLRQLLTDTLSKLLGPAEPAGKPLVSAVRTLTAAAEPAGKPWLSLKTGMATGIAEPAGKPWLSLKTGMATGIAEPAGKPLRDAWRAGP